MTDQEDPQQSGSNLPALIPSASLVLRRTQTTLGLLHEVVQESSADYWFERGGMANENGEWGNAVFSLNICLSINPDYWWAELQIALAQLQDSPDAAASAILRAYQGPHNSIPCHNDRWSNPFGNGLSVANWERLKINLETHKKNTCDSFVLLSALSLVYWQLKIPALTWRTFDEVWLLCPERVDSSLAWYFLFDELLGDWVGQIRGDYVGQQESLINFDEKILFTNGQYFEYFFMANAKHCLEDKMGALDDYNYAINICPVYALMYYLRGNIKRSSNDHLGAVSDFSKAIEIQQDNSELYFFRAMSKVKLRNFKSALADFDKCVSILPFRSRYYDRRGMLKIEHLDDYEGGDSDMAQSAGINRYM